MKEKELLKIINYIEDKDIKINDNWFYHGIIYNKDKFESIITNGIKSGILRGEFYNIGSNGPFYICVSKNEGIKNGAFDSYIKSSLMFILDENLKVIKTNPINNVNVWFTKTPLPIRNGYYKDEYQVFNFVDKKHIIALEYYLYYMCKHHKSINNFINLKEMVVMLDKLNLDLSIYDYSTNKEINRSKVLKLDL